MGRKILKLFDIEFKQIQRRFLAILSILVFANVIIFAYVFYTKLNKTELYTGIGQGLTVLKSEMAREVFLSFGVWEYVYSLTLGVMFLALALCALYCIRIWTKNFSEKSKTIYTLFMMPNNKFIIFLSKLLTMIVLIYSVILVQHICWLVEGFVLKAYTGITIREIINSINYSNSSIGIVTTYPIYPIEFVMIYIIGPIVITTVIFAGVLMSKSFKKIGGIIGIIYFLLCVTVFFSETMLYYTYSDILFMRNVIFDVVVICVSVSISYILLNKRVHV